MADKNVRVVAEVKVDTGNSTEKIDGVKGALDNVSESTKKTTDKYMGGVIKKRGEYHATSNDRNFIQR
jgi:copper chaperone CopZ